MSDNVTINLALSLLVAAVVAMASRRMRLPYNVGLVAAGIVLALLPIDVGIPAAAGGVFTILLLPLIFEAALQIRWPPFRRELLVILLLAFERCCFSRAAQKIIWSN